MATRSDISFNMDLSPRIITVESPSTEVTIQDLHDTCIDYQDGHEGGQYQDLISTAGKESLGGGTTVGITATLQNARLAFAARTAQKESGTATSTGTTTLVDTTAQFVTNGVTAGAMLINYTDRSIATVISVSSETTLTHEALQNGVSNAWALGDFYSVSNEIQCNVTGGNLVAVDSLGANLDPIFPTVGTQIVRASSSSATLTNLTDIEHGSYNDEVTIDTASGVAGTSHPTGTSLQPSNNITDAISIATTRGFKTLRIVGSITIGATPSLSGYRLIGRNRALTKITFSSATTSDTSIEEATFAGSLSGSLYARNCTVETITGLGGTTNSSTLENCALAGNITLRADNNMPINLLGCTGVNNVLPELDVNGSTGNISIHAYADRLTIKNITSAISGHFSGLGSELTLAASCTAGTFEVHGDTNLINNSTMTVDEDTAQTLTWQTLIEGVYTGKDVLRLLAAIAQGNATGLESGSPVFKGIDGTTTRIAATYSAGTRTVTTRNPN